MKHSKMYAEKRRIKRGEKRLAKMQAPKPTPKSELLAILGAAPAPQPQAAGGAK